MALLEVCNLTFQPRDSSPILQRLTLSVNASEIHAILGTNGTGKSTLAYIIMGCEGYEPTSGSLFFGGTLLNPLKIYERASLGITLAWQEPVRFEGLSVNDYLSLKKAGVSPSSALEMVGLSPDQYLPRMVDRCLSGGERKRIELASIMSLKPRLAILDEPDSGIDMLSTREILNVIESLKRDGSAVLLITHREEIALIADRASQLCMGRIVFSGSSSEVAAYYKSKQCITCGGEVCPDV